MFRWVTLRAAATCKTLNMALLVARHLEEPLNETRARSTYSLQASGARETQWWNHDPRILISYLSEGRQSLLIWRRYDHDYQSCIFHCPTFICYIRFRVRIDLSKWWTKLHSGWSLPFNIPLGPHVARRKKDVKLSLRSTVFKPHWPRFDDGIRRTVVHCVERTSAECGK